MPIDKIRLLTYNVIIRNRKQQKGKVKGYGKHEVYLLRRKRVNTGIIVNVNNKSDMSEWEYIGSARTKADAKRILKSLENCWNN